jgi:hypothetical protein
LARTGKVGHKLTRSKKVGHELATTWEGETCVCEVREGGPSVGPVRP